MLRFCRSCKDDSGELRGFPPFLLPSFSEDCPLSLCVLALCILACGLILQGGNGRREGVKPGIVGQHAGSLL
jgi:hypothetical protein